MKIRLYVDEDAMDADLVRSLRAHGVDLETAYDADMITLDDRRQLAYATAQGRVLFSFNKKHFCRLHAELLRGGEGHADIVVGQQRRRLGVGEQMRRLLTLVARLSAEEMRNRLEFLSDWADHPEG